MSRDSDRDDHATDWILCYLVCPKDAAGGFLGGILLTDNRARPQHFGFVQPVKPSTMQRILYGSTLDEHVRIDVITKKLWDGLPNPPDVVFVNEPGLIDTRRITNVPTAFLKKVPDSDVASLSTLQFDTGKNVKDQALVGNIVITLDGNCNLLEPFTRINDALKEGLKAAT